MTLVQYIFQDSLHQFISITVFYSLNVFFLLGIPSLDVIVIEEEAPAKLIVLARQKHIPMVTVEWIIQTLIHGEKQDFDVWPFQDAAAAE